MSPREIYQFIRDSNVRFLPQEVIDKLLGMDQVNYDEIIVHLLIDDGKYTRSKETYNGHYDYHCQLQGYQLFILRPNSDIYQHVLDNAFRIADPSSCEIAVVALLQIKPAHDVATDLLNLIDEYSGSDEKQSHIMSMFYWLGTGAGALSRNLAWPSRQGNILYRRWFNSEKGLIRGETDPVTGHPLTPPADSARAKEVAIQIVEKMLDLFEENNTNQTARSIISLLPLSDKDYLMPYRERIIQAYISGQSSSDDYVRHRAGQTFRHFKKNS